MGFIKEVMQGILIGIANAVPGVSGGTMMVSMGIYDKIIRSINQLFSKFVTSIKTLFPYLLGMAIGIIGLAFSVELLFSRFPFPTAMLFIGLILGGVPVISDKVKGKKPEVTGILLFLVFFALIIIMQFLNTTEDVNASITLGFFVVIKLILIGGITAATMIIPGVSGSMILMALGYYTTILESVSGFVKALVSFDASLLLGYIGILLPFGIGVVIGMFLIAKLIEALLTRHERNTYFAILGLVFASPFAVLMGIGVGNLNILSIGIGLVTFAAGFAVAYLLSKSARALS